MRRRTVFFSLILGAGLFLAGPGAASGPPEPGEALIVPPNCARTPVVRKIRRRSVIYLSGWATRLASRADFDADVLLPMSDHADFPDLLRHVTEVAPQSVVTMHGYAGDFARILLQRGIAATPLTEEGERRTNDDLEAVEDLSSEASAKEEDV